MENKKRLKKKCIFVKGAKNAAIYDLNNKKVYSINHIGKAILEDFIIDQNRLDTKGFEYINKLYELGLIEETSTINNEIDESFSFPKISLPYVWLELTEKCNLHCIHCYGQFCTSSKISRDNFALTTQDWKQVILNLKKNGCNTIHLLGGEPLCFQGFHDVLLYAHNIGIKTIDISTNGTLVDDKFVQIVKKTNANVRMSIFGHNDSTHEAITGIKGSFQKMDKALKLLSENKINVTLYVTIMKINQQYIKEIENYASSLNHEYKGYDTVRIVKGKISCDNYVNDVEILKPRYRTSADFSVSEEQYIHNLHWNTCLGGKMAVSANGDVFPCPFIRDTVIGNVLSEDITVIMDKALPYWSMTLDHVDCCKDCEYRYACGDCRPLSKGFDGNIKSKQLRCCYDPYTGIWQDIYDCARELSEN